MDCNSYRLNANEIMRQIYANDNWTVEERIAQLHILKMYAQAAIDQLKAQDSKKESGK